MSSLAKLDARAELIRESWVKAMELRLVQNELAICHQAEGVNHYENCRKHSQKYLSMLKENRVCFFPIPFIFELNSVSGEGLQSYRCPLQY